jgi:hypothetical protein
VLAQGPMLPVRPPRCARAGALPPLCRAPATLCRGPISARSAPRVHVGVRRRLAAARASSRRRSFRRPRPMCGGAACRPSSSRTAAGRRTWRMRPTAFERPPAPWFLRSTSTRGRSLSPMCPWRRRTWPGSYTCKCRPRACRRRTWCSRSWRRFVALFPPTWWSSSAACPAPPTRPVVVVTPTLTGSPGLSCLVPGRVAWRTSSAASSLPRSIGCAARLPGSPFSWRIRSARCCGAIRRCKPSRWPSVLGSSPLTTVWRLSLPRTLPSALLRNRPGTWRLGIPRCLMYAVPLWDVPTGCRLHTMIVMPTSSSCLGARRGGGFLGRSVFQLGTLLGIRRASMASSSLSPGGLVTCLRRRWSRRRRRWRWRLPTRPSVLRMFVSTASPRRPASTPRWSSTRSSAMCYRMLAWRPP